MKPLSYGMAFSDFQLAQAPHPQFEEFNLFLGWRDEPNKDNAVAKYELYGITVMVYDKVTAGHIMDLTGIGNALVDMEVYLERILFLALQQNPMYLEYALKEAYNRGANDGRRK